MGLSKRWSDFSKDRIGEVKNYFGVYEIADAKEHVLYIGEGKVRDSLFEHLPPDGDSPIVGGSLFRYEFTHTQQRARRRRSRLVRQYRDETGTIPKFNDERDVR